MVEQWTYSSADLPADLKCQILSFLRVQWPEGFMGENRLRDWITQEADHPVHIVLVDSGVLISHTNVVWKQLAHAGTMYNVYGLTGVFTYPAFRGEGYGGHIVAAGTAFIRASDADVALFHCDFALRDFYAQYGWIPLDHVTTYVGPVDAPTVVDELLMMQFLSPKGQQAKASFERQPLFWDSDSTW